jgi:3-mercaptopyruvate sulfurtransferase SseA
MQRMGIVASRPATRVTDVEILLDGREEWSDGGQLWSQSKRRREESCEQEHPRARSPRGLQNPFRRDTIAGAALIGFAISY